MLATLVKKHSTAAFFVLTYLITWAFWIPFAIFAPSQSELASNPDLRTSPVMLTFLLQSIGNYGPTIAAILLWTFSGKRAELKDAFKRVRPHRASLFWYFVALLLPIGMQLPGLFVYALLGGNMAGFSIVRVLLLIGPYIFLSGLGEELGWRGYALTNLQMTKSPFISSLIVGAFWGVWHLPIIYYFSSQSGLLFLVYFVLYVLFLTATSIIFTWVYNATDKSLLMAVLMHAATTASGNTILLLVLPSAAGTWIPYIVNVLSISAVAVLVIALNRTRMFSR